ncbi:MAG: thioredoxin family protein [Acidiphilium sp.]|nr:thioredoxin family protein [Acidiphilium sp.]MDD4936156.1 thioredoxin family protein [Acidiphilium sp.]
MSVLRRLIPLLVIWLLTPLVARAAESNQVVSSRASVSLVSATKAASGSTIKLGLLFRLQPNWHIYWSDPGDAGEPPSITITSPEGTKVGPFAYPAPHWLVASGVGDYTEDGTVLLPFTLTTPRPGVSTIDATADWLVCDPKICVPEHGRFALTLPGGTGPSAQAPLFAAAAAQMPRPSPFRAIIAPDGTLAITGAGLSRAAVKSAHFYPDDPGVIVNAAPQKLGYVANGFTLGLKPADAAKPLTALAGVLEITDPAGQTQALTIAVTQGVAPAPLVTTPWFVWIGAALLGGLILNLMPCVFPVLAIKAMAVTRFGRNDRAEARRESLAYTAGAVLAMLVLGGVLLVVRAGGTALGWGFQFQSPVFIAVMAWLVFAIGLNFAGMYEISGMENLGSGLAARGGLAGSFATGLLAVVVATPCTAPFMGGALAAALAAPMILGLSIFAALGLGIALPFVLVAIVPGLARVLPRPGAWMDVLRQFLAFPMFATAIWLLWVMALEAGASGVLIVGAGGVSIGFALWLLRFHGIVARGAAVLVVIATGFLLPRITTADATGAASHGLHVTGAVAFSPEKLTALREAGKPVLVDMTAAWCITCQVNERVALEPAAMQRFFRAHHVTLMMGDWTRRNPAITAYLAAHGRDGVPIYVFYPPDHAMPVVLPQILTPAIVTDAIAGR